MRFYCVYGDTKSAELLFLYILELRSWKLPYEENIETQQFHAMRGKVLCISCFVFEIFQVSIHKCCMYCSSKDGYECRYRHKTKRKCMVNFINFQISLLKNHLRRYFFTKVFFVF